MSKIMVTRLFLGATVAVIVGWVIAIAAVVSALAGGAVTIGGPDIVTVSPGAFASTLVILVVAAVLIAAGTAAALVSWIGALFNTARLEDKTWFVLLLVLGLWSFGFVAMIAYVVAGPDGAGQESAGSGIATAPGA